MLQLIRQALRRALSVRDADGVLFAVVMLLAVREVLVAGAAAARVVVYVLRGRRLHGCGRHEFAVFAVERLPAWVAYVSGSCYVSVILDSVC